jgi:hypothetical protein
MASKEMLSQRVLFGNAVLKLARSRISRPPNPRVTAIFC